MISRSRDQRNGQMCTIFKIDNNQDIIAYGFFCQNWESCLRSFQVSYLSWQSLFAYCEKTVHQILLAFLVFASILQHYPVCIICQVFHLLLWLESVWIVLLKLKHMFLRKVERERERVISSVLKKKKPKPVSKRSSGLQRHSFI